MTVKKTSWHYRSVGHKTFVKELEKGNQKAVDYIVEVSILPWICISLPLLIAFPAFLATAEKNAAWIGPASLAFIIVISMPLWLSVILSFIGLFLKRKWKELKVV